MTLKYKLKTFAKGDSSTYRTSQIPHHCFWQTYVLDPLG